jgi:hypothetical protein
MSGVVGSCAWGSMVIAGMAVCHLVVFRKTILYLVTVDFTIQVNVSSSDFNIQYQQLCNQ